MSSWIRLYRSITDSAVFDEPEVLKVWIWILCRASYRKDKMVMGRESVDVLPGQFPCSRKKAAKELKMTESKFYRIIKLLEEMGCITIETNSKYSKFFVVKWEFFQGEYIKSEQRANSQRTASEQPANSNNKKYNKINKYNNTDRQSVPTPKATAFSNFTPRSGIDYKALEMQALKRRIERSSVVNHD